MSATLYMGYRPTEERIRDEANKLFRKHKITKLELNINRDAISYWYMAKRCRNCDKEYDEESSSGSSGFCCKACEIDWWKQVATLKPTGEEETKNAPARN